MKVALAYTRASDTRPNDSLENSTTKSQIEVNPGEASACGGADSNSGGPASDSDRFDHLSGTVAFVRLTDRRSDDSCALRILVARAQTTDSRGCRGRPTERGRAVHGVLFYRAGKVAGPSDDSAHLDPPDYRIARGGNVAGCTIRPNDN